jgi:hypothetical protein
VSAPERFTQALVLGDPKRSHDVAAALWAALLEVQAFYAPYRQVSMRRFYLGDFVPQSLISRLTKDELWRQGGVSLDQLRRAKGPFVRANKETVDAFVRRELAVPKGDRLLVVTDFEITPPAGWRYIIWDDVNGTEVVSTAPVDPRYWRMAEDQRVAVIKHRVRTACLSVIGDWLGLTPCENETCFLYSDVESSTVLDTMVHLGEEHKVSVLAWRGFEPLVDDPERVQPVIERPATGQPLT